MVVLNPAQEGFGFLYLRPRDRRRRGIKLGDYIGDTNAHPAPVIHRGAYVAQNRVQRLLYFRNRRCGLFVDFDMHHRFTNRRLAGFGRAYFEQLPGLVSPDIDHRVNYQKNGEVLPVQLGGDGIDQKRHIVIDDLDNRMRAGKVPLAVGGAIEDPHLCLIFLPGLNMIPGRKREAEKRLFIGIENIFRRNIGVVPLHEKPGALSIGFRLFAEFLMRPVGKPPNERELLGFVFLQDG